MDFQQVVVVLVGIGCVLWIGMRIYRTFKGMRGRNDPCADCPTGCELYRQLRDKRKHCEKNEPENRKSCCG